MQTRIYINIVLLLVSLLQPLVSYGQTPQAEKLRFSRLSTTNGLSQSTINTIVKDKTGYLWFGTNDGLNRFDGYKFKIYRNVPSDTTSLAYNLIRTLYVDSKGNLWVGTLGGGLVLYDEKKDSFRRYDIGLIQRIFEDHNGRIWIGTYEGLFNIDKKSGEAVRAEAYDKRYRLLKGKTITAIIEDKKKNIWVGTMKGLYLMHANSSQVTMFFTPQKTSQSAESEIADIAIDQKGTLWVGSKGGLYRYHDQKKKFYQATFSENKQSKPVRGRINVVSCDSNNIMWVGTEDGLGLYDTKQSTYKVFRNDTYDAQSLSRNSVNTIYVDKQSVWIGTSLGGINKYDKNKSFFSNYRIYNPNNQMVNTNVVTSFAEDLDGEIFIGTDGGGLFLWNAASNTFKPFQIHKTDRYALGESVLCLQKSRNGEKLWIGTYDNGMFELNLKSRKLTRFYTGNHVLRNNAVYAILEDKKSNIWIGTNGGGVTVIDHQGLSILQLDQNQPNTLTNNYIRALMEDEKGNIWIGTYGGINIFDPGKKKFVSPDPAASELERHIVCTLFRAAENVVWIGTQGTGLFIYDTSKKSLSNLSEKQGLSNNNISGIIRDHQGSIWISTSRGLNRLPLQQSNISKLKCEDILGGDEFVAGAAYTCKNGDVLFGTVDGFNLFNPGNARKNHLVPPVVITDIQIPKSSRNSKIQQTLKNNLSRGELLLDHEQSVFTIEFAALNFSSPEKNKYAYMLEGLDKDWQYTAKERKVTYNNLRPGNYVFHVKGSNNDGVWNNEGASLKITILPPFWRTQWAYFLYTLIALLLAYFAWKELKSRERLKNELLFQKLTASKNQELNRLKMNFFTNVSHELRTPLSMIIDPLRKISGEDIALPQIKDLSGIAFTHASRLHKLVNELLDIRKFQERATLERTRVDIKDLIEEIFMAFKDHAAERGLVFSILFDLEFSTVSIDSDKFQKIITNLITNAFKFTPNNGSITLTTKTYVDKQQEGMLEIHLADTGGGISESYKDKIFDMFFQVKEISRFEMESSGIGLALVKELVDLHNGEISEEGKEGEGALFVLKIPAGSPADFTEGNKYAEEVPMDIVPDHEVGLKPKVFQSEINILIVEDNDEIRKYIASQLAAHYNVEEAKNGQEGYEKAVDLIPNIVVSDVMMDNGDGLELCKKIKTNEKTSHIPVILLTAKHADEGKIQGYKSGADAYVSKPFNSDLLVTRIENLLESRKLLSDWYSNNRDSDYLQHQGISEIDHRFLQKASDVIVSNLLEPGFDVAEFATLLDMNRRQLTGKLKAIVDQTPHEFIIHVRLKNAIELMLHQDINISQAAYQVGFAEPANFSRSFSKVYGKSPKHYMNEKYGKKTL
ncbi:MAG: two-component regulator propeller domain-containing protein [Pelobium sp.]